MMHPLIVNEVVAITFFDAKVQLVINHLYILTITSIKCHVDKLLFWFVMVVIDNALNVLSNHISHTSIENPDKKYGPLQNGL